MLSRVWVRWGVGGLLVVGLIGAWLLRPDLGRSTQDAVVLQVESACDSAQRGCTARGDGLELELRLGPPVRAMESFAIALRSRRGNLSADAQVEVQFQMRAMDMGINRYRLTAAADGAWRGSAILPVCSAGRNDWIAQVNIVAGAHRWRAELPFTLASP